MTTASCQAVALVGLFLAANTGVAGQCPECGPEAIAENEPNCGLDAEGGYDDFVNGGCYAVEPQFTPIELGRTICGTAAVNTTTGVRDSDWYELVLTEETELIWLFSADFVALLGIVDNGGVPDCDNAQCFLTYKELSWSCSSHEHYVTLPAGTWWFYVAPIFNDEVACDFQYTSTVLKRLAADLNGDGYATQADVNYLIGYWGYSHTNADLNDDNTVDILDLLLLLELWPI